MGIHDVVVWEFEGDIPNLFTPYQHTMSNAIEDVYRTTPTEQNVKLGDIDHLFDQFEIDFVQMVQSNIRHRNRKTRKVRRQKYQPNTTIGNGVVWEWNTEHGWVVYDAEAIDAIEQCYNKNEVECDLQTLQFGLPNVVLLRKGYQRNKGSGFVRPVRRTLARYKYDGVDNDKSVRKRTDRNGDDRDGKTPSGANAAGPSTSNDDNAASGSSRRTAKRSKIKDEKVPHLLEKFCVVATNIPNETCAICLSNLNEEDQPVACSGPELVFELKVCKHMFHESCLEALYKQGHNQNKCLRCPICKQIHGTLVGDQPLNGQMSSYIDTRQSVAGYEGDGMIVITYDFPAGIQGADHPNPGTRYVPYAFPRVAYLPANAKGKQCLKLLQVAFDRRLIFTVGTSSTSGADNVVTWTNIHHKTSAQDRGSGHGFPDPGYLDNLLEELKNVGVTEDDV